MENRSMTLEEIIDYSMDLWPVHSLYELNQLAYVLKSDNNEVVANKVQEFLDRMERHISEEFMAVPYEYSEAGDNTSQW